MTWPGGAVGQRRGAQALAQLGRPFLAEVDVRTQFKRAARSWPR